ncbi:MAG: translation initiation factor IF-2 [Lentisphaerae bacterium]|nr:translation initiation factor IF-2 [Lentisphaerota bacterium]
MSDRVRVYELARELGLANKEMIDLLQGEGIEVRSHSSTIEAEFADLVRERVIAGRQQAQGKAKPRPKAAPTTAAATPAAPAAPAAAAPAAATPAPAAAPPAPAAPAADDESPNGDSRELHLKPPITVRDLAEALGRKPNELIGELFTMNVFAAINQVLDVDLVEKICARHGVSFVRERRERIKIKAKPVAEGAPTERVRTGRERPRPPVIAFMGHVDHGKTSLQDRIRNTRVAAGETGGITQHIGASVIHVGGQTLTLLDTPGHEAFTAMRARGANATDIAVLVVAADDGVMPQTIEAYNHAKAAGVPIVVALNKMDLPNANPDRVRLGLQQLGIQLEDWGGDTAVVPVSAVTGEGVEDLLERLLLEAEVLELDADPDVPCEALIIEAQLEAGMGPTASVLVRNGTLHVGDIMLCGAHYGKARALIDHLGKRITKAGPSTPVKVLGLSGVPEAGDPLVVVDDEREARDIAAEREMQTRQGELANDRKVNLEDLFRQMEDESRNELKLIVKADVRGSLEAIRDSVAKIKSEKIRVDIIHSGVGEITDNDIGLAAASDALVVGFHVRAMPGVNRLAKQRGVEVRLYGIIYELLGDIEKAMLGRLEPEMRENALGTAQIIEVFELSRSGKVCGCRVEQGVIRVGAKAKVFREGELVYHGQIASLRRFKDDVREVRSGLECGIRLDNFPDFEVGDSIQAFELTEIAAKL